MDRRPVQLVEPGARGVPLGFTIENEMAFETETRGERSGHAGVVRTHAAERDHAVRSFSFPRGEHVLQLADFVAAESGPGVIVMFDVETRPAAERGTEARHLFDRSSVVAEAQPGDFA